MNGIFAFIIIITQPEAIGESCLLPLELRDILDRHVHELGVFQLWASVGNHKDNLKMNGRSLWNTVVKLAG